MKDIEILFNLYDIEESEDSPDYLHDERMTRDELNNFLYDQQYDNYVYDMTDDDDELAALDKKFQELIEVLLPEQIDFMLGGVGYSITQIMPDKTELAFGMDEEDISVFYALLESYGLRTGDDEED